MSDVQRYFEELDPDRRSALEETWNAARRHAPDAEVAMSYGMPALKHRGRPLIGMTASARHLSVHPFSPAVIAAIRDRLEGFGVSKGTIRFTADRPLPDDVIADLIRLRTREIDDQGPNRSRSASTLET
jgi:uncharacterized protein YdhG (YjbR/CyaY superfamily)